MTKDRYTYFRVEARELLDGLARGVLALENEGPAREVVGGMLRMAHTLKGAARVVKQVEISESAHGIEDVLSPHRDSETSLSRDESSRLLQLIDGCAEFLSALSSAPESASPQPRRELEERFDSVRIEVVQLDALLYDVAEAQIHLEGLRRESTRVEQMRRTTTQLADCTLGRLSGSHDKEAKIALAVPSLVEDLRTAGNGLRASLRAAIEPLERDLARIRERVAELRLLPASTIGPSLDRSVRDAGQALQKRATFEMSGGEQRLDAHVLLALRDALIHVVRNAVAHGIETPAQRAAAGKSATGRVRLDVRRIGQHVCLRIDDDGAGIDLCAVRRAAVERGRATEAQTEALGLADAAELLLQGGLSTSATVSEVSGRGIGLDVVRTTVQRLKGTAELQSRPGCGTTLEMSVPVSLESMDVLAAAVGETSVLLPFAAVHRIVRAAERDIVHSATGSALVLDDRAIPMRPLRSLLGRGAPNEHPSRSRTVVIIESAGARAAVGIDRIDGIRNAVIRPLPGLCGSVPLVAGATLNGLGNPELVLDPASLIAAVVAGSSHVAAPRPVEPPSVLVVDDSLTTRMLEQSILESAGFRVDLAASGEEALLRAKEKPHALFVVDVEMPGMNGFDVLRRFRDDPQLQATPAIIVSSLGSPEARRCALDAGARDYIVKSEFDESRLLRTIRELVEEVSE